jgi:RNA polymerase sigma factor (sigma-70 family)
MHEPPCRIHARQNRYLLKVYALLHRFAPEHVREDHVDDVVHEIVESILVKVRAGSWVYPAVIEEAFIRRLIVNRRKNRGKERRRGAARDAEHLRSRELMHPIWTSADQSETEEKLAAIQHEVVEKLPKRCRHAYYMVREEGSSYREAARRLRVSEHTVRNYIVTAHRSLRHEFEKRGIGGAA